jgi:hypothetical protein
MSKFQIFKEEAGILAPCEMWVCLCGCYMYEATTLKELIELLNTEWEHEKHLVG